MNRGPIVLTIDEAEVQYLLDQMPPPSPEDDEFVKKLRQRLKDLLADLRAGAEVLPPLDGSLSASEVIDFHLSSPSSRKHAAFSFAKEDGTLVDVSRFEFARAAHRVAHILRPNRAAERGVVGIVALADALIYQTLVTGCIAAGLIPFPISHRNSEAAISHVLHTTGAHRVLTTRGSLGRLVDSVVAQAEPAYPIVVEEMPTLAQMYPFLGRETPVDKFVPYPPLKSSPSLDDVVLYLHSSGSTGLPKSIPFTHHVLLSFAALDVPAQFTVLAPRLAVGALPPFHAMAVLAQFVATMFSGVTACGNPPASLATPGEYVIPPSATPQSALEQARRAHADGVFAVPAFLLEWAGREEDVEYLKGLKLVAFSGGPLATKVGDFLVEKGIKLAPIYGGTEFGAGNTLIRGDKDTLLSEWTWMEFSKRVNVRWAPVGDGTFECQFLRTPTHILAVENLRDAHGYATKDLFEQHPTKPHLFRIVGRLDDVLIMANGEKAVPGPMEDILNSSPLVAGAVMFGRERNQIGVLIEPAVPIDSTDEKQLIEFRNAVWDVVQEANELAPAFARIYKEMILVTHPERPMVRTPKRTVVKKAAVAAYEEEITAVYETIEASGNAVVADIAPPSSWLSTDLEPWLAAHAQLLSNKPIRPEVDLFDQGFDSLNATFMRHRVVGALKAAQLVQEAKTIPQNVVYQYSSVHDLAAYVAYVAGLVAGDGGVQMDAKIAVEAMIEKYTAGLDGTPGANDSVVPTVILLTGSTGGLGSHILDILLRSSSVERVYAFNRPSRTPIAQRQRASFEDRGLDSELLASPKLVYLEGDTTRADLGLTEAHLAEIQSTATVFVHNAWTLDFNKSLSSFEPHIRGTRNLVDIARRSGAKFLFTSSIASAQGWDQRKGAFPEELQLDASVAVGNGYGEGKYVAERILAASGLRGTSFRIGQVTGSTSNGSWSTTDWVPAIVKSSIALGSFPSNTEGVVAWLQPEAVAQAIVDVALLPAGKEQPFAVNLVHPRPVSWDAIFGAMARIPGLPMTPMPEWIAQVERRAVDATADDLDNIPAVKLLDFLKATASSGLANMPFATERAQEVSGAMAQLKGLNDEDVQRWMGYWKEVRFLDA
ncbi:Acetyl-CoA synthetase-like protein [Mycena kentingensis (nom. inval.)]|nr:Acetyl-CoA synthetase-like protein [Mycena kentingensis (nom. inval.)]